MLLHCLFLKFNRKTWPRNLCVTTKSYFESQYFYSYLLKSGEGWAASFWWEPALFRWGGEGCSAVYDRARGQIVVFCLWDVSLRGRCGGPGSVCVCGFALRSPQGALYSLTVWLERPWNAPTLYTVSHSHTPIQCISHWWTIPFFHNFV